MEHLQWQILLLTVRNPLALLLRHIYLQINYVTVADQMDLSRTAPVFLSVSINIYLEKFLLNQLLVRHTVILYFPLCWTLESKRWCFVLWISKWAKLIKAWPRDKTHLSIIALFACIRKFWQINQILRQQFHECNRVSKLTLKIPSS